MLKIKDSVDLKELEKFGFRYLNEEDYATYDLDGSVETNGYKSWVLMTHEHRHNDYITIHNDREIDLTYSGLYYVPLDLLYDLIKADMVEKV